MMHTLIESAEQRVGADTRHSTERLDARRDYEKQAWGRESEGTEGQKEGRRRTTEQAEGRVGSKTKLTQPKSA